MERMWHPGRRRILLSAVTAAIAAAFLAWLATATSASTRQPVSVYWGAYVEGHSTYARLFGGTWGNSPWDAKSVSRFERDAGKRMSIQHYGQPPPWEQPFDAATASLVVQHGAIPAIDMDTRDVPLREVAAGERDASITAWAEAAAAWGHPFFLLFDEEMNGSWYPYSPGRNGNTTSDFVAAWRHVHDLVSSAGASNVTWAWCPNVDPSGSLTPYDALYPGDDYVDWTCLNGYNWGGSQWMTFDQVFARSYRALLRLAPTKPVMIGEISSDEAGGSKASWITNAFARKLPRSYPRIKAVLWFNWRIHEKGRWWPWEIESSRSSQAAFWRAIRLPYYASGGKFGSLATLSKVEPLSPQP